MRRLNAILVLFSAVLLGGCQASSDSTSANEGGILRVLRPDPITVPETATLPLVLETAISSATSRSGDLVVVTVRLTRETRL
jgi:hypothetical protein